MEPLREDLVAAVGHLSGHPGHRQTAVRSLARRRVVVVATAEPGVRLHGHPADVAPGDLQCRRLGGGGRQDHAADPIGIHHRPLERLHPAHRPAHDRPPPSDAQRVGERRLHPHDVADGDDREARAVGGTRGGIGRRRTRGALTAAEDVAAHDEVAVRVDGATGSDQRVPPARLALAVHGSPTGMAVAGERVADEHGVRSRVVQRPPGLVRDLQVIE